MKTISLQDIYQAQEILQNKILHSPLIKFRNEKKSLLLKAESLQEVGSFKIRGATYAISTLSKAERQKGVVAYSTGNHAQAVALAATLQGIESTIVMSPDVPKAKVEATVRFGGKVVMAEPTSQARKEMAEKLAQENGLSIIPPYDDPRVIAGQCTIGLEILAQYPQVSTVIVPVGGGGLIAGIAFAIKSLAPHVKIIGVEPEWENDAYQSFQQKKIIALPGPSKTIADAIIIQKLGDLPFTLIHTYVDQMATVTEDEIAQATLQACKYSRLVLEPAGAIALAYALNNTDLDSSTVIIASGGNTTLDKMCQLGK